MSAHLLDIIIAQGTAILELLASEDQSLLVRRNAFLVLDLRLDIVNGVRRLHLKGDSLAREGLDEAVGPCPVSILFPITIFLGAEQWQVDERKFADCRPDRSRV